MPHRKTEALLRHLNDLNNKPEFDLTGKRFGRLLVLGLAGTTKARQRTWRCRCNCGTEKIVGGSELKKGATKSCGCLRVEQPSVLNRKPLAPDYTETTPNLAYLVGMMMGDGNRNGVPNSISLDTIDRDFAEATATALTEQFGRVATVQTYGMTKAGNPLHVATLNSVEAKAFLLSRCDPEWIRGLTKTGKLAWLRGIWDSEGCVHIRKSGYGFMVTFDNTEKAVTDLYQEVLLDTTGVLGHLYRTSGRGLPIYTVTVCRLKDVVRFYESVQPTIPRKRAKFEMAVERLAARGGV